VFQNGHPGWFPPNDHEAGASPNYLPVYAKGNHAVECAGSGYKNATAQFQRMMEWVHRDIPNVHTDIEYIIVGSDGGTVEELIENHTKDIRRVLKTLEHNQPSKVCILPREVESLGHVIRERTYPAPWEQDREHGAQAGRATLQCNGTTRGALATRSAGNPRFVDEAPLLVRLVVI